MIEEQIKSLKYLLSRLDILRDKISARNEGKEKFNVFSCLLDKTDEVCLHSRFISSLIDPKGSHGLGYAPLDFFLSILDSSFQYNKESLEIYPSSEDWGEHKKIDILLIDRKTRHAIILENKINACDSNHEEEGQLERYYRRIIEEDHIPEGNVEVFYLTVDGHEPSQESVSTSSKYKSLPDIVQCITYGTEISQWLQKCLQVSYNKPYIRETIAQYLNLIKEMTNDNTEVEDRLEIIKLISKNEDTLASAKLLFDNYKHIQWHTIFDLFNDFYSEIEERGYSCESRIDNKVIDDIVHGNQRTRKQYPQFTIKDKNGLVITIGCDFDDQFYFGLKNEDNKFIKKTAIKNIKEAALDNDEAAIEDEDWIFWNYFDVSVDTQINIWHFENNETFRVINPTTRKETIKEYLDAMETSIYKRIKIKQHLL